MFDITQTHSHGYRPGEVPGDREPVHDYECEACGAPLKSEDADDSAGIRCSDCVESKQCRCACGYYFKIGEEGIVDGDVPKCVSCMTDAQYQDLILSGGEKNG